ncbi:MAG: hypothetical protein ACW98I_20615, partial [Candidatus Hodarchaeales archaeon]
MINNSETKNEIIHHLPKCPKYPPQRTRFNALGRLSLTRHPIILLLVVLSILSSIFLRIPPAVPNLGSSNLVTGTTGSAGLSSEELVDLVYTTDGGFALAITTTYDVTGDADILLVKTDMNGLVQWSKTYGRLYSHDVAEALVQTSDGGYALVGRTRDMDYWDQICLWFIKTDAEGSVEWNKTFWGSVPSETIYGYDYVDGISGIVQNQDGDFILTMELAMEGEGDQFLVKIDSEGTLVWRSQKLPESLSASVQTQDGGLALAGYSWEYGAPGQPDILLVKTDSNGLVDWSQTIDCSGEEYTRSLVPTADGGFALSGFYGLDAPGASLFWFLMKTDSNGVMTWWQTYHESSWSNPVTLVQTTDGGFALAGINRGDSGFVSLVKTDGNGDMKWSQTYSDLLGNYHHDLFLVQTADRGLALAGTTNDGTGLVDGGEDVYLMKIAENGTEEWQLIFDGTFDEEWATDLIQTVDGEFVFTGYVGSRVGLVKTDGNGLMIWSHIYGRSGEDVAKDVIQTVDGGFVIAGSTSSQGTGNSDAWLIKTDENGVIEWTQTYGGLEDDGAEAIIQTTDEGFALAGFTRSYGAGDSDAWLIKTDKNGIIEWNQSYGEELDDKALHLYQLTNGSILLLGYFGQYWNNADCGRGGCSHWDVYDDTWLLITDETGLLQQEFKYKHPGKVRFHDLMLTENSINIVGTSFWQTDPLDGNSNIGQDALFLLRMNQSGLFSLWNKSLPSLSYTLTPEAYMSGGESRWVGVAMPIFTTDGEFILSGQFDFGHSLMKINANGVTQWELTSPMRIIGDSSIIQTTDGGYTLAGGVFSHGPNGDSADAWLARIDE